jgi:formylglycine-generating enzyme required for sulfatase activity
MVRSLPLKNVQVTPLFTYIHYFDPSALDAFAGKIVASGGRASPPIALRLPVLTPKEDIMARARRALLERRDLWSEDDEPAAEIHCMEAPPPHSARLCTVPAGRVWLGDVSKDAAGLTSNPPRLQRIDAFDLDEKEISVAQYERCVAAQQCRAQKPSGVSANLVGAGGDLPQPDLSWSDANDYCSFAGLRLPTEAEWVRAARGSGLDPYPWGAGPPGVAPPRANLGEKAGEGLPHYALAGAESPWVGDGVAGLARGCHFPLGRSPFGHCDLIGSLLEWVDAPTPTAKGGSWIDVEPKYVRIGLRATIAQPRLGSYLTGARCARSR